MKVLNSLCGNLIFVSLVHFAVVQSQPLRQPQGPQADKTNGSNTTKYEDLMIREHFGGNNCFYVVDTPDPTVLSVLYGLGLNVTTSATIPANLSPLDYALVICREYSACTPSTAPYIGKYVRDGGGVILMGGTPSTFCGGGFNCSCISDWFGTSRYSNVGVSYAKMAVDKPLGTSLIQGDIIEYSRGWGGAAVTNVAADATVLARWDYGSDNIHSFIRSYQKGRVAFWAGDASYNAKTTQLYRAVCKWASGITISNCLYVVDTPDPALLSVLNELRFSVTTSTTIPANLSPSDYALVICREYSACTSSTAPYIGDYVKRGGGAILMGGTPSSFCGGGYSSSCISQWFGTSQYTNVGVSYARMLVDNPLGTSLIRGDVIEYCGGWGGAAVTNVASDAMILARWDYGSNNIHSFIRSYQSGRVAFWAGDVSYNARTTQLFKATCAWATRMITNVSVDSELEKTPNSLSLFQNYPNPFNPATTISYSLPKSGYVLVQIFNINGEFVRVVVNEHQTAGSYSVEWDAHDESANLVASGIYICRVTFGKNSVSKRMILAK